MINQNLDNPIDQDGGSQSIHILNCDKRKKSRERVTSMAVQLNYFITHTYKSGVPKFESLEHKHITHDFVGGFAKHLALDARRGCKPCGDLLAYSTCQQYFSGFKTHFLDKFHENPPPGML